MILAIITPILSCTWSSCPRVSKFHPSICAKTVSGKKTKKPAQAKRARMLKIFFLFCDKKICKQEEIIKNDFIVTKKQRAVLCFFAQEYSSSKTSYTATVVTRKRSIIISVPTAPRTICRRPLVICSSFPREVMCVIAPTIIDWIKRRRNNMAITRTRRRSTFVKKRNGSPKLLRRKKEDEESI